MTIILKIRDTQTGLATATSQGVLAEVEGMQFSYSDLGEVPDTGLSLGRGVVPAGGEVAMHASDKAYAMYIVTGEGFLFLQSGTGSHLTEHRFAPGMVITFPPKAMHGWRVDGVIDFEWFGVEIATGSPSPA